MIRQDNNTQTKSTPQLKIQSPPQKINLITGDSHNCLHLTIHSEQSIKIQIFIQYLNQIQAKQTKNQSKAIWIHLNSKNLHFIQFLLQKNYIIHHGIKKEVSLYKWTANEAIKDNIPPYSKFYVGCGAMIIKNNKVFLVQQKSGDRKGFYGLPGGRADPGQLISQAVIRQLYEQTGIHGKFQYIIYFRQFIDIIQYYNLIRQLPKSLWGSSDLYFVSIIQVQDSQLKNIKLCQQQISSYIWVDLNEYGQFIQKNGIGSQVHVGKYITELYKKGFDFKNKFILSVQKLYKKNSNAIMVEHLVAGL